MPFKKHRDGHYVYDPKGNLRLPPASPALQNIPGLKITWETPVKPAIKPPKPKPKPKP
ncbi:MAG: hypothetical protein LC126_15585 [Bryobacterales bacterium]|nr:hypothetical protein [Bryobacterales bacterium]